jgi:hypothetical protein
MRVSWCSNRSTRYQVFHLVQQAELSVHGLKLLERYRGIVQCDGYAAYKTIAGAACEKGMPSGSRHSSLPPGAELPDAS